MVAHLAGEELPRARVKVRVRARLRVRLRAGCGLGLGSGLEHRVVLALASEKLPWVLVDGDAVEIEVRQVGVERAVLAHLPQ